MRAHIGKVSTWSPGDEWNGDGGRIWVSGDGEDEFVGLEGSEGSLEGVELGSNEMWGLVGGAERDIFGGYGGRYICIERAFACFVLFFAKTH